MRHRNDEQGEGKCRPTRLAAQDQQSAADLKCDGACCTEARPRRRQPTERYARQPGLYEVTLGPKSRGMSRARNGPFQTIR